MAPHRVIIDTDPGVDDILAILLALAATPEEIEVVLLSITFGNIDIENCLRNIISMFHIIEKELEWRRKQGKPEGFKTLKNFKPIVAVGADQPLEDQMMMADYFHGTDGLGGIHSSHPHLTPPETWKSIFTLPTTIPQSTSPTTIPPPSNEFYTPSPHAAHLEILRILETSPPNTVSIIAIGPLTNLALAATKSPSIFLRAKQIIVMGGAIQYPGNMTPVAEFNTYADSVAAARVYALTSPNPKFTMPPAPPPSTHTPNPPPPFLGEYDLVGVQERLNVKLFPLDVTSRHLLTRGEAQNTVRPLVESGSPLAEWVTAILESTYRKIETLGKQGMGEDFVGEKVGLSLHDPLCVWYALSESDSGWMFEEEDIRVETAGQWTRGMCVVDRRGRKMMDQGQDGVGGLVGDRDADVSGDTGGWLSMRKGNRLKRVVGTPGEEGFGRYLLERIFG
ncbi:MAG: hypothetical protein M1812_001687 [Candelaria pacifica]|nr:MAG: hypothetical protein M1812_001687 [Candelaria pacifica]